MLTAGRSKLVLSHCLVLSDRVLEVLQRLSLGLALRRAQATFGDWQWKVPESEREDPTPVVPGAFDDGGAVLTPAADGERRDVFLAARWSYDLSGVYAVAPNRGWNFDLGARLHGREGYPLPYHRTVDLDDGLGPRQVLLPGAADDLRLDDLHLLDLRAHPAAGRTAELLKAASRRRTAA